MTSLENNTRPPKRHIPYELILHILQFYQATKPDEILSLSKVSRSFNHLLRGEGRKLLIPLNESLVDVFKGENRMDNWKGTWKRALLGERGKYLKIFEFNNGELGSLQDFVRFRKTFPSWKRICWIDSYLKPILDFLKRWIFLLLPGLSLSSIPLFLAIVLLCWSLHWNQRSLALYTLFPVFVCCWIFLVSLGGLLLVDLISRYRHSIIRPNITNGCCGSFCHKCAPFGRGILSGWSVVIAFLMLGGGCIALFFLYGYLCPFYFEERDDAPVLKYWQALLPAFFCLPPSIWYVVNLSCIPDYFSTLPGAVLLNISSVLYILFMIFVEMVLGYHMDHQSFSSAPSGLFWVWSAVSFLFFVMKIYFWVWPNLHIEERRWDLIGDLIITGILFLMPLWTQIVLYVGGWSRVVAVGPEILVFFVLTLWGWYDFFAPRFENI